MKSKKLMATLLAVTVVASSALVGCGGGNKEDQVKDNNKKPDVATEEKDAPKDAEQFLNEYSGEPTTLDPVKATTNTTWAPQGMIYEGLTRYQPQPDGTGKMEPGVAESWEASSDGLKYTFKLRKDSKWHDGKPVTAKDFVYTWQRVVDPKTGSGYGTVFNGIVKNATDIANGKKKPEELGVKAVDDNTFEVELEKPCAFFMELTYFPVLKPVRKDIVEKYGKEYGSDAKYIMGNGAYKLTEWVHKNKLVFEKNNDFWDAKNRFITKVTWKNIPDENAKMQAYQNGEIDSVYTSDANWVEKFKSEDTSKHITSPTNSVEYFIVNAKNEYLKNAKVRQAITLGFDREEFCKNIINGVGIPAYGLIPPTISVAEGKPYTSLVKNDFIKQLQEEHKDPKKLLQEGLKELGKPEDTSKVQIRLYSRGTREQDKEEAEFFQQQFKQKLGIELKVEQMEYDIMYDRVDKGNFDLALGGWFADWDDPSSYLDNHNSVDGYYRKTGWVNKEYDELSKKAKNTKDPKERAELYGKAEKILLHDESAIIPIYIGKRSTFRRNYVKNSFATNFGFGDLKGIYISGRKK
ncbi:peptide ABC transporter substrate-binding protein [Hathewaya massiliensis]|uniref:peptide ABC transporter substrate-binding protein n=1 Tax=Hathewaya massiliensis TaxID=1964382 RepID=UPI0011598E14|nr:peptide ABC transporter substrate-binding protein [Hathewaya massiliensis]